MTTKPVEQPKNRQQQEMLSFDEQNIVMLDYTGNYIEYQFEELRLKDYRAKQYDKQLINFEYQSFQQSNPLNKKNLDSKVVNSPTINTKIALEQLEPFLKNTPQLKSRMNSSQFSKTPQRQNDNTIDFEALKFQLIDAERRNEMRAINKQDDEM